MTILNNIKGKNLTDQVKTVYYIYMNSDDTPSSAEDTLTPVEVAHLLRIAKNTVYELVKRGELPAYRAGKMMRFDLKDVEAYKKRGKSAFSPDPFESPAPSPAVFIMCGQDVLLDILAHHLEARLPGLRTQRSYLGSYNGLHELYMGNVHLASSHLWDAASDSYTLPFLPHLLPGMPLTVVRLVRRMVGFYVAHGNPKGLAGWADLGRTDLQFVNREAGSGIRVLVDGRLRNAGHNRLSVPGYSRICTTHLVAATTVARGGGDYAVGSEMAARQVAGVTFIPLQEECYDLVFPSDSERLPHFRELIGRICSAEFRLELEGLGGYGTGETGKIMRI